jgi:protein-S-isoprenylcysteine O-methyltransferase Ste14
MSTAQSTTMHPPPVQKRLYDALLRASGSGWFLLLAMFMAQGLVNPALPWSRVLAQGTLCAFYLVVWVLLLIRPPPKKEAEDWLPRVAGFVGSYLPWCISFFAPINETALNLLSSICVVGGTLLMIIAVLHLGRSFSLVPQARAVVRSGPYRLVRHPLYLAEEIAIIGVLLQVFSPITIAIFLAHLAVQVCRITFEEDLLRWALPDYAAYGHSARWRLVPYIW